MPRLCGVGIVPVVKLSRPVLVNGILGGVIVLALVGGGLWLWHPWSASASGQAAGTQLTSTVQQGQVSQTVTASGSVDPVNEVSPSFTVSGTIATIDVAVGQTVTAGQQIATIDPTDLKEAQNEAWTAYVYAVQDLDAAEQQASSASSPSGGGQQSSTSSINSAKQAVTKASDAYQQAKAAVAAATLTSPIAGLVVAVNGTVGGSSGGSSGSSGSSGSGSSGSGGSGSSSGSGVVTIADTSSYVVTANIAEADIADVAVGQTATVTFPALTGVTASAKVTAIAPTATSSNSVVTYATTITLDKLPDKVRLGQTAQVAITVKASAADALYVPAAAITTSSDGTSTVKVVDAKTGKTTTVDVTTGVVGDQGTEITKGLTAGETVVIGTVSANSTSGTGSTTGSTGRGGLGGFGGGGTFTGGGGFGGNGGGFRSGTGGNG
jgi:macrolide-specific efflux system membrane fusion protein